MIREQINIISSQQEMRERSFALNQSANMSFSALSKMYWMKIRLKIKIWKEVEPSKKLPQEFKT